MPLGVGSTHRHGPVGQREFVEHAFAWPALTVDDADVHPSVFRRLLFDGAGLEFVTRDLQQTHPRRRIVERWQRDGADHHQQPARFHIFAGLRVDLGRERPQPRACVCARQGMHAVVVGGHDRFHEPNVRGHGPAGQPRATAASAHVVRDGKHGRWTAPPTVVTRSVDVIVRRICRTRVTDCHPYVFRLEAVSKTLQYDTGGVSVPLNDPTVIELPPRLFRVRLRGALFDTDKAFLLPGAMAGARGLVHVYGEHPGMSVVVTGHADRVGSSAYNLGLSNERAEAMAMFLRDDADGWMRWYAWRPYSAMWGIREDQHMLGTVPDPATGLPYYRGPAHGWMDQPTSDAVRRVQHVHGLSETGTPNPDTRRALIGDYMGLDGTSLPPEASVELLGCGEHHNEIETGDHVDEQANRRVEVFLFDDCEVEPPVPAQCPDADCPYLTWRDEMEHTIDFDTDLGELVVGVVEHDEHAPDVVPIEGAQVRLERDGFPARILDTPATGIVRFGDVVPGTYTLAAYKEDFEEDAEVIEVVAGGSAPPDAEDDVPVQGLAPDGSDGSMLFGGLGDSGGGGGGGGGGNKPRKLSLQGATTIHIVEELPANLQPVAKEGVANAGRKPFERLRVLPQWGTSPAVIHQFEVGTDGKTVLAKGDVPEKKGELTAVERQGPNLAPLIYTLRDPSSDAIITAPPVLRGKTTRVKISARTRLSIWAFAAPLVKSSWKGIKLDGKQMDLMKAARLDDLTLNYCMAPPKSNWTRQGGKLVVKDTKVAFSARLGPGGMTQSSGASAAQVAHNDGVRDKYLRAVVAGLHKRGIQVIISYTVGTDGPPGDGATPAQIQAYNETERFNQEFADWLFAMSNDEIDAHAKAIDDFRERYDADGVGFNIEMGQIKEKHRDKLQRLVRTTAKWAQLRNGVVAYATAPFTEDGKATAAGPLHKAHTSLGILSYALAKTEKNLIARPMCFATTPFATSTIEASLEYALAPESQGGVGLDPAQIQFGIFGSFSPRPGFPASEFGPKRTARLCREKLRPNRQGMIVYSLPPEGLSKVEATLEHAKAWEAELNPGEVGPGGKGQPVQVPRWMQVK